MSFAGGSLVRARGREWVVLPESTSDTIVARPLGGGDQELAGFFLPLEKVEPATFQLPEPAQAGDYLSCRLLRDALRLGFRSSAGQFRSFARIAVEPRHYQLVPLLMALKLDPVRLLIADDVGIGKTIEVCLIIRELIDRGEIRRFTVLCPPQIAEQWQEKELSAKFHLDAELVLPGTVGRLERACRLGQSIFDRFPSTVVSTDFIKADRRRDDFLRAAPELVVVDESHTCAWAGEGKGARHQRHTLVKGLAADPKRHLILVTATPHSGNEAAFRSLLALLDPAFGQLPDDLSGTQNEQVRRHVAAHFIQRRRADIRHFLKTDTPFPDRDEAELTYRLSPDYKRLFEQVLEYARESVTDPTLNRQRQRIRWWSALALLRSMASSPAAAAMTLRTRAVEANTAEEADANGRRSVLDLLEENSSEGTDVAPAGDAEDSSTTTEAGQRLLRMSLIADELCGRKDAKMQKVIPIVRQLLDENYHPILFCRFIPTAEYVAQHLRDRLKGVEVVAVTGTFPPKEWEDRVAQLGQAAQRVLVCTDCLSEGINLQEHFNAVIHYDLSWNPTRHEQREGRVDRYGQPSPKVRQCWLERWSKAAQEQGLRALDQLRGGVEKAIEALGRGFLHPNNTELLGKLRGGTLKALDYYRQLLRLVYRLLFLFVAEDRGLLFGPQADEATRDRYTRFYSTVRLRRIAEQTRGTQHTDLYRGLELVLDRLGGRCAGEDVDYRRHSWLVLATKGDAVLESTRGQSGATFFRTLSVNASFASCCSPFPAARLSGTTNLATCAARFIHLARSTGHAI